MSKRVILLGSKPGSVAALLFMVQQGWDVVEVVATPDQAAWLPGPSLHQVASALGIRTVRKQDQLEVADVDLVISYMFRSLVTQATLNRGRFAVNFHAGPLPEFGGWAFYNLAILEESPDYGCTCHVMDNSFDTGPLVKVRRFSIESNLETAISLEKKAQKEMCLLFREVMDEFECENEFEIVQQPADQMRYLNKRDFEILKRIPLGASKMDADRIARAFWYPPYQIAYYELANGTRVEVIPEIAKNELAHGLHERDLTDLLLAFDISTPSSLELGDLVTKHLK